MKVDSKSHIDRNGVSTVQLRFSKLRWLFREQAVSDYGIDAQVEVVEDERATGQLIALQIKSGKSWFDERVEGGVVFRGDIDHLNYWQIHSLPVIVVLYDPDTENCHWQVVNDDTVTRTKKAWKLTVPCTQKIDEFSKEALKRIHGRIVIGNKYTILSLRDVSTALAKRYSANILLNGEFTRTEIVQVVRDITEELKTREYYRNDFARARWSGVQAHAVWLFIYPCIDDVRNVNWVCRSQWVSGSVSPIFSPHRLVGSDIGNSITVDWNDSYVFFSRFHEEHTLTKEAYLEQMALVLEPTKRLVQQAIGLTNDYADKEISDRVYLERMVGLEEPLTDLYFQAGDIGLGPMECDDLAQKFQEVMALAHNIVLPFSERGLETWSEKNRNLIVRDAIRNYSKELIRLGFELEKIC